MDIQSLFAERIGGAQFGKSTAIYKFEKIKRAKRAAREAHPDVEMLDFGVGEPDQMAPRAIRQALKKAVDDPANRGYADNGIAEFRVAAAKYMADFWRHRFRPGNGNQPHDWFQAGAGDDSVLLRESGRCLAGYHSGLSRHGHAYQVFGRNRDSGPAACQE